MLLSKEKPGFLRERSDLGLGQGLYKISLEHCVVPEGKDMLPKPKHDCGAMSKGPKNQLKALAVSKAGRMCIQNK